MLRKLIEFIWFGLIWKPDKKDVKTSNPFERKFERETGDDKRPSLNSTPIVLTHRENQPTAVLVVTTEPVGIKDVEGEIQDYVQWVGSLMFNMVFRHMGGKAIPIRYVLERKTVENGWNIYASLLYFNPSSEEMLDNLLICVDPLAKTVFYEYMLRHRELKHADAGTGSLEEALVTYIYSVTNEMQCGSTRVRCLNKEYPLGLVGWLVADTQKKGSVKAWVEKFFKPSLSVVKKDD